MAGQLESMEKPLIGLCTAPNETAARQLIDKILQARLAACVNIIPGIQSHYWWEGKQEQAGETLLLIKTSSNCVQGLKDCITTHHDYEVPELIFVSVTDGLKAYMEWIEKETRHAAGSHENASTGSAQKPRP